MKILFIILFIFGYISISVFGIFGMHTQADMSIQGHMAPNNCIAATAKGVDCPKEVSPIDFVIFHLDALKSFSLATFGENILVSLLALVLLAIGVGLGSLVGNYLATSQRNFAYRWYELEQLSLPLKRQFLRWLALHENSPSYS